VAEAVRSAARLCGGDHGAVQRDPAARPVGRLAVADLQPQRFGQLRCEFFGELVELDAGDGQGVDQVGVWTR
jgi:hypothetical protein